MPTQYYHIVMNWGRNLTNYFFVFYQLVVVHKNKLYICV